VVWLTAQWWPHKFGCRPWIHTQALLYTDRVYFLQPLTTEVKGVFTWFWPIAYNSSQPSLSQNLIDLDGPLKSPSPCAASWHPWPSGGRSGLPMCRKRRGSSWQMRGHPQSGGQSAAMRHSKSCMATTHWSEDMPVSLAGNAAFKESGHSIYLPPPPSPSQKTRSMLLTHYFNLSLPSPNSFLYSLLFLHCYPLKLLHSRPGAKIIIYLTCCLSLTYDYTHASIRCLLLLLLLLFLFMDLLTSLPLLLSFWVPRGLLFTSLFCSAISNNTMLLWDKLNVVETKKRRRRERARADAEQIRTTLSRSSSECAGKLPEDSRQSVLQLCGSYLSLGGSEQIGSNCTARVCFMSQQAAEAWAPHHKLSLASTPICFMLEYRPLPQSWSPMVCVVCVCVCVSVWMSKPNSVLLRKLFHISVKSLACVGFRENPRPCIW